MIHAHTNLKKERVFSSFDTPTTLGGPATSLLATPSYIGGEGWFAWCGSTMSPIYA